MHKKAEMSMEVIIACVIGMILLVILTIYMYNFFTNTNDSFEACPTYCTSQCGQVFDGERIGSSDTNPDHNKWCQVGIYDLSEQIDADSQELFEKPPGTMLAQLFNKFEGDAEGAKRVTGKDIGLQCCSVPSYQGEPPVTFLRSNLRVDEDTTDRDGTIIRPPYIRGYFSNTLVRSGETMEMVANKPYTITMQVERVEKIENGIVTLEEGGPLTCTARVLNELNEEVTQSAQSVFAGLQEELCNFAGSPNESTFNINLPSSFEGRTFTIELLLAENEGKYKPRSYDARFTLSVSVINPIRITGISDKYVQEKTLSVTCKDIECTQFWHAPSTKDAVCNEGTFNQGTEIEVSKGKGLITFQETGVHYVCVKAQTAANEVYYNKANGPILIDREPPQIETKFVTGLNVFQGALSMHTNASCFDERSGCTSAIGFFYIDQPVDFIFALVTGASNPERDCPAERTRYSFNRAQATKGALFDESIDSAYFEMNAVLPYYGTDTLRVLCVMVEDNAGNFNRDILLNYNSWDVVQAIANDQRENGGYGTGYTGYLH